MPAPCARWRPSRCTCSSTPRSSATSGRRSSRRWRSPTVLPRLHGLQLPHLRDDGAVTRLHGAGRDDEAKGLGAQALWLGLGIGVVLAALAVALAVRSRGSWAPRAGSPTRRCCTCDRRARRAVLHARRAGQGFLRGRATCARRCDPRRARTARQRRARAAVRLRLRLGARRLGVGHRDRPGRDGRPRSCGCRLRASGWEPPRLDRIRSLMRIGGEIAVRTTALLASFLVASARAGAGRRRRRWARTRSRSSCSSSSRSCSTRSRSPGR